MGFKCGIIGLPNVGKSTLFNKLTKANVKVANFPFCTIKPNIGVAPVPDPRIYQLAEIVKSNRLVPSIIEFVDIAGLIKDAAKGEGLGNQFLTNIHEMEAICHVVRCFENNDIVHITGKINPEEDVNIVNTELILFDLEICKRAILKIKKQLIFSTDIKLKLLILEKCLNHLNKNNLLRVLNLSDSEKKVINYLRFLTLKPTMYIANVNNNEEINNNRYVNSLHSISIVDKSAVIVVCVKIGSDSNQLKKREYNKSISKFDFSNSKLNQIIRTGYQLLNLQTYFTISTKEIHAWTIQIGTTALQAAEKIHTDFKKGFIRAQIISFEDFINFKGEQGAKKAGKIRYEGKNYIIKDGDIVNFLFNV